MKGPCFYWLAALAVSVLLLPPGAAMADLTWDVDPYTADVQDGPGTWVSGGIVSNWWNGTGNTTWNNGSPAVAVFGATAGDTVTVASDGVTATGLHFYQPYTLATDVSAMSGGSAVTLTDGATITVQSGLTGYAAVINARLMGTNINVVGIKDPAGSGNSVTLKNPWTDPGAEDTWTHLTLLGADSHVTAETFASVPANATVTVVGNGSHFGIGAPGVYTTTFELNGYGPGGVPNKNGRGAIKVGVSNVTLAGDITLQSDTALAYVPSDDLFTISGQIKGSSLLLFQGVGTTNLTGANTNTGDTELWRGNLRLNSTAGPALNGNFAFAKYASSQYAVTLEMMLDEQIVNTAAIINRAVDTATKTVKLNGHTETVAGIDDATTEGTKEMVLDAGYGTLVLAPADAQTYVYKGSFTDLAMLRVNGTGSGKQVITSSVTATAVEILGGTLQIDGALTAPVAVSGGALGGSGTVTGTVTTTGGTLAPGASAGMLTVDSLNMSGGGGMTWQLTALKDNLTGAAGTDFDQIAVTTALTFNAGGAMDPDAILTLDFSELTGGAPSASETFWTTNHDWTIVDVADTGATTGAGFGSISNPTYTAGDFTTYLSGNDVILHFEAGNVLPPIPGDTDNNRIVDAADAARLAQKWGENVGAGGYGAGDFNGDGFVNAADASILAANWGNHTGGEATAAVPEPAMLSLLLLGAAGLAGLRRRGRQR